MVVVIKITNIGSLNRSKKVLKGIQTKIPVMTSKAMMRWGKTFEKDLKTEARTAGIESPTGTIYGKGIEYRQRPNGNIGRLFMRNSYVMLDSMKSHWVNLKQSRGRLLQWAARSRNFKDEARMIQTGDLKKFPIFVRPHPFIRAGWNRARPKLNPILKQEMRKVMAETK